MKALKASISHFWEVRQMYRMLCGDLRRLFKSKIFYMALVLYAFLIALSVKKAPVLKVPIMAIACLPIIVMQGASMSIDSMSNGLGFLIFSFFLSMLKSGENSVGLKDIAIFTLLTILIALCRTPYLAFIFLLLFIPIKNYKTKFYYLFLATLFCMTSLSVSSCTKDEVNEQTELVVKDATNHNEALKLEQDYPIENLAFLMKGIFVLEDEQNNITSVMAFDQDSIYIFSCNTCQYKHKKYQLQQNGTILQIDNQKIPIARWAYLNNHNQGIIPLKLTPDNTQYWLAFEKIILGDGNEQQEFDRTQLIAFIRNQKP